MYLCVYCGLPGDPIPYQQAVFTATRTTLENRSTTVCAACIDAATTPSDPEKVAFLGRLWQLRVTRALAETQAGAAR